MFSSLVSIRPRKRGLALAKDVLVETERWLTAEAIAVEQVLGGSPLVAKLRGRAGYLRIILEQLADDSQGED